MRRFTCVKWCDSVKVRSYALAATAFSVAVTASVRAQAEAEVVLPTAAESQAATGLAAHVGALTISLYVLIGILVLLLAWEGWVQYELHKIGGDLSLLDDPEEEKQKVKEKKDKFVPPVIDDGENPFRALLNKAKEGEGALEAAPPKPPRKEAYHAGADPAKAPASIHREAAADVPQFDGSATIAVGGLSGSTPIGAAPFGPPKPPAPTPPAPTPPSFAPPKPPSLGGAPKPPTPGVPFGAPKPPTPGVPFGAPKPPTPGVPFGAPKPPTPGVPFGAPKPPTPGVPFGAPKPPTPSVPFGAPKPPTPGVPIAPPAVPLPGTRPIPGSAAAGSTPDLAPSRSGLPRPAFDGSATIAAPLPTPPKPPESVHSAAPATEAGDPWKRLLEQSAQQAPAPHHAPAAPAAPAHHAPAAQVPPAPHHAPAASGDDPWQALLGGMNNEAAKPAASVTPPKRGLSLGNAPEPGASAWPKSQVSKPRGISLDIKRGGSRPSSEEQQ